MLSANPEGSRQQFAQSLDHRSEHGSLQRTLPKSHPTLEPDGCMRVVGTRYHPDDIYGTLIDTVFTIKNKKGKAEAISGANDDRVISIALAVVGFRERPPKISILTPEAKAQQEIDDKNKAWHNRKKKKAKKKKKRRM